MWTLMFGSVLAFAGLILSAGCASPPSGVREARAALAADFQGVVVVERGDERVFEERFGALSALSADDPLRMRIGSVTKTFTAAAIRQLVEDDRLTLDDTIDTWFPEVPRCDRITVRHLLEHTSGLADFSQRDFARWMQAAPSPADMIAAVTARRSPAPPGFERSYHNLGYVMLGEIIERVSGQSYESFVHNRLLVPLGLTDTGFARCDEHVEGLIPGHGPGMTIDERRYDHGMITATGGMYSTPHDLVLWARYCQNIVLFPGIWESGVRFGRAMRWHSGNTNSYSCFLLITDDGRDRAIIMSNEGQRPMHRAIKPLLGALLGDEETQSSSSSSSSNAMSSSSSYSSSPSSSSSSSMYSSSPSSSSSSSMYSSSSSSS